MYSADDLYKKLKEIEDLIRENVDPEGSLNFDSYRVMAGLELARRMIICEES